MTTGRPISSMTSWASSSVWAMADDGTSRPMPTMASLNRSRSSAVAMASALAPIISGVPGTPMMPASNSSMARFSAGLAAQRGQDGVGPFLFDDAGGVLEVERLDVGGVGELGVGHDRGRVRVHAG